jgi:hypothetical protein
VPPSFWRLALESNCSKLPLLGRLLNPGRGYGDASECENADGATDAAEQMLVASHAEIVVEEFGSSK